MFGPVLLARWLLAALRSLPRVVAALRRAGLLGALRRLARLHRRGDLRVLTRVDGGAPGLLTIIFAGGDVLTKVTPAGLTAADAHLAAVDHVLDELAAARGLLGATLPLVFVPCLVWGALDLHRHAGHAGLLPLLVIAARDLALAILLPNLILWLIGQVASSFVRRALADAD
ncbi:MAG TPA: hypothetical protein PKW35_23350 [Nannocystaceae bacterium]|nr:hypothetical protein [Nannocystaceae bacterium]